jgi:hypothetical protein
MYHVGKLWFPYSLLVGIWKVFRINTLAEEEKIELYCLSEVGYIEKLEFTVQKLKSVHKRGTECAASCSILLAGVAHHQL